jgi:hypothetical protein
VFAGNYAAAGASEIFRAENESYQVSDNRDWVRGRHALSFGMNYFRKSEIDWDIMRHVGFGSVDGLNAFSSSGSDLGYQGGDCIADLMMGIPSNMWVRFTIEGGGPTSPDYNIVFPYWGFYVNDKFRLSPKLTISAGLRWDISVPDHTLNPTGAPCCAIYSVTADGGILEYPGIAQGLSNHYFSAEKHEFAPRLSIAYSPNLKTVVRAGYGVFFDAGASQATNNNVGTAIYGTSAAVNYSVNNATFAQPIDTPFLTFSNVFPDPVSTTLGSFPVPTGKGQGYLGDGQWAGITYYDQKSTPVPYIQRMLLDVQRQVGSHDVLTLSYAGAQGRKGQNPTNINLPNYSTGWTFGGGSRDPDYNAARPNAGGRFGNIYGGAAKTELLLQRADRPVPARFQQGFSIYRQLLIEQDGRRLSLV